MSEATRGTGLAYGEESLPAIAAELGMTFAIEPYQVRGNAVYSGVLKAQNGTELKLVLWPTIGRVDAYLGGATMVLKGIDRVDIYPGVEVTFRRHGGGYLFVTRSGQAYMTV